MENRLLETSRKKAITIVTIILMLLQYIVPIAYADDTMCWDLKFKEISIGQSHVLAIDTQGNLYEWGKAPSAGYSIINYISKVSGVRNTKI